MTSDDGQIQLRCSLYSSGPGQQNEPNIAHCTQEEGKKSSFLLQPPDGSITIVKPAHLKVGYRIDPNDAATVSPFFLGGFQLVSNAKHVEVYLTDKEGKETYLMTSKGIFFEKGENGEEWYKAVSVVPGGPRPITKLHIKLLSLKPKDATLAFLQSLKITARIPDAPPPAQPKATPPATKAVSPSKIPSLSSASESSPSKAPPPSSTSSPPHVPKAQSSPARSQSTAESNAQLPSAGAITQQDLGAAMSSLSLMAKNAEDRIENAMCERFAKMEGFLEAKWERMEKHVFSLTSVVIAQKSLLAQKVKVMNQQQETLNAQAKQLESLSQYQKEMSETVSSLSEDVSKIRKVLKLVVDQGDSMKETSTKYEKQRLVQDDLLKDQTDRIDVLIQHQRELQSRVQTLQVQVSELSQGLRPIMEEGEAETEAEEESRYESENTDNDLMQFPDSDDDDELRTDAGEDESIRSGPTRSLQEHFATTTAKQPKNGIDKMAESVPETADMTDMESSFNHVRKIEVNLLDDSSEIQVDEPLISLSEANNDTKSGTNQDGDLLISFIPEQGTIEERKTILGRDAAAEQDLPEFASSSGDALKKPLTLSDSMGLLKELAFDFTSDGHLDLDFIEKNGTKAPNIQQANESAKKETTSGSGFLFGLF